MVDNPMDFITMSPPLPHPDLPDAARVARTDPENYTKGPLAPDPDLRSCRKWPAIVGKKYDRPSLPGGGAASTRSDDQGQEEQEIQGNGDRGDNPYGPVIDLFNP